MDRIIKNNVRNEYDVGVLYFSCLWLNAAHLAVIHESNNGQTLFSLSSCFCCLLELILSRGCKSNEIKKHHDELKRREQETHCAVIKALKEIYEIVAELHDHNIENREHYSIRK